MMPHLERSLYPWNWADYPAERRGMASPGNVTASKGAGSPPGIPGAIEAPGYTDEITPWLEAFVNARNWIGDRL
jgi:phosphoribosylformylglycinamidine synthase